MEVVDTEGAGMVVDTEVEGAAVVTEVEEVIVAVDMEVAGMEERMDIWVECEDLPVRGWDTMEVGDMGTPIGISHIGRMQCCVTRIVIAGSMHFVETDIVCIRVE